MTSGRDAAFRSLAAATLLLLACDGSDDDGPTGSSGSFAVSVTPSTLPVQQNATSYVTVTLTRTDGFSGAVTLTVSGAPTGVSATMTPAVLSENTVVSRIDFAAAAGATPGTSTVTITGTSGTRQASTTFALTIQPAPEFSLSITPAVVTLTAGSSSGTTVNVHRTNFEGPVTLSLSPPQGSGFTGVFASSPTTSTLTELTISAASNAAAGIYTLVVNGTAAGLAQRQASVQVNVVPGPGSGNNVAYVYCDPEQVPAFFAFQDGGGPWQVVAPAVSGATTRFSFNLTSGRGGILVLYPFTLEESRAFRMSGRPTGPGVQRRLRLGHRSARSGGLVAAAGQGYATQVLYGSLGDLVQDGVQTCSYTQPFKIIRGTVSGLATFQYSVLSSGNVSTIFQAGVNINPVSFNGVQGEVFDFMGSRLPSTGSAPDRAVVFRNLTTPDEGTLPSTIDFNGPASFVPASATVTITGAQGDRFEVYNQVVTTTSRVLLWNDIAPSRNSSRPWAGLPAGRLMPAELHSIIVFADTGQAALDFRVATKFVGSVSNQTITFGPVVTPATVTQVSAGAYPRFRFQGALPPEYNRISIDLAANDGNYFNVIATSAWLAAVGTTASYDLTMPDVAGLPGFPAGARVNSGSNLVTTDAFGFEGPGVYDATPILNLEARSSVRRRTINVP